MNDERINAKLSIIKRNNLFIISGVSLLFIIIKFLLKQPITELYLFFSPFIVLLVALIIGLKEEVRDERVIKKINRVYDIGFWFVVLSGLLFYFIYLVFFDTSIGSVIIPPNASINLMLFLCLILSFVNVRKNHLTFNYRIIELEKKEYYKEVFKRILYMFLYFLFILLLVLGIRLFVSNSNFTNLSLSIVILISFLSIAFQYFLFSIYEKIHYNELVEKEEGKYRYITSKVFFLFLIGFIYGVVSSVTVATYSYYAMADPFSSSIKPFYVYISFFRFYLLLIQPNFILLTLVMNILVIKSLKHITLPFNRFLKLFWVLIFVSLGYGFISWVLNLAFQFNFLFNYETVILVSEISAVIFIVSQVIAILFQALIIVFLNKNSLHKEVKIFLVVMIMSIVHLALRFIQINFFEQFQLYSIFLAIGVLVTIVIGVLKLVTIKELTNRIEYKEMEEDQVMI
jgi:hypothetical protein